MSKKVYEECLNLLNVNKIDDVKEILKEKVYCSSNKISQIKNYFKGVRLGFYYKDNDNVYITNRFSIVNITHLDHKKIIKDFELKIIDLSSFLGNNLENDNLIDFKKLEISKIEDGDIYNPIKNTTILLKMTVNVKYLSYILNIHNTKKFFCSNNDKTSLSPINIYDENKKFIGLIMPIGRIK